MARKTKEVSPVVTLSDVTITLTCEPEDVPVRGNAMASGDDAYDRKVENRILSVQPENRGDRMTLDRKEREAAMRKRREYLNRVCPHGTDCPHNEAGECPHWDYEDTHPACSCGSTPEVR
jgi:hypothetical protein